MINATEIIYSYKISHSMHINQFAEARMGSQVLLVCRKRPLYRTGLHKRPFKLMSSAIASAAKIGRGHIFFITRKVCPITMFYRCSRNIEQCNVDSMIDPHCLTVLYNIKSTSGRHCVSLITLFTSFISLTSQCCTIWNQF